VAGSLAKTSIPPKVFPTLGRVGAGPAPQQAHIVVARPLIQLYWRLTPTTSMPAAVAAGPFSQPCPPVCLH